MVLINLSTISRVTNVCVVMGLLEKPARRRVMGSMECRATFVRMEECTMQQTKIREDRQHTTASVQMSGTAGIATIPNQKVWSFFILTNTLGLKVIANF